MNDRSGKHTFWLIRKNIKYQFSLLEGNSDFPLKSFKKKIGISLVAQWLRIHLPMQGTWVRALVREDPTCRRVTKPVRHNY